ncbi:hypothetical protein NEF87_002285 [Candidatus Lokiarchaeum ossiferum]|uniref:Uncharacterized protein n=1 Tax=Candidatus Lokiarchaeum ossiferum TaxID=2951803 RepID=A0ABY6HR64_9ARCH|nr:hypothetical protein NEF87_002285 [Candidatus Lokiarchaeum sp. B-35]
MYYYFDEQIKLNGRFVHFKDTKIKEKPKLASQTYKNDVNFQFLKVKSS